MKRDIVSRTIKIAVLPKGDPVFSEKATFVEIVDEAAGEFIEISQCGRIEDGKIRLDNDEWPAVRSAIDEMVKEIKKHQKATP